jgi:hypothetical protein
MQAIVDTGRWLPSSPGRDAIIFGPPRASRNSMCRCWSASPYLPKGSYRVFCWPLHTKLNAQRHARKRSPCSGANPLSACHRDGSGAGYRFGAPESEVINRTRSFTERSQVPLLRPIQAGCLRACPPRGIQCPRWQFVEFFEFPRLRETPCELGYTPCSLDYFASHGTIEPASPANVKQPPTPTPRKRSYRRRCRRSSPLR